MSVAFMTPKTAEWVYEAPRKIVAQVVVGINKTTTDTVTLYDSELNWRGEIFLACGMYKIWIVYIYWNESSLFE